MMSKFSGTTRLLQILSFISSAHVFVDIDQNRSAFPIEIQILLSRLKKDFKEKFLINVTFPRETYPNFLRNFRSLYMTSCQGLHVGSEIAFERGVNRILTMRFLSTNACW